MEKIRYIDDVRRLLEEHLNRAIPDRHWQSLVDSREAVSALTEIQDRKDTRLAISELARIADVLDVNSKLGAPDRNGLGPEVRLGPDRDAFALSEIAAIECARDDFVSDFRKYVLRGRLIRYDRVAHWVERQAKREAPPTRWVTVPESADKIPQSSAEALSQGLSSVSFSRKVVMYPVPGELAPRAALVTAGGVLEKLLAVCGRLEEKYGWSQAQASAFVVSGAIPRIDPISGWVRRRSPFAASSRAVLEVDPRMHPDTVAAAYRQLRRDFYGGKSRNYTEISKKRARLAVFVAARNRGHTWDEIRRKWNNQESDWSYPELPQFIRDARNAYRRLTGVQLEWKGKGRG